MISLVTLLRLSAAPRCAVERRDEGEDSCSFTFLSEKTEAVLLLKLPLCFDHLCGTQQEGVVGSGSWGLGVTAGKHLLGQGEKVNHRNNILWRKPG